MNPFMHDRSSVSQDWNSLFTPTDCYGLSAGHIVTVLATMTLQDSITRAQEYKIMHLKIKFRLHVWVNYCLARHPSNYIHSHSQNAWHLSSLSDVVYCTEVHNTVNEACFLTCWAMEPCLHGLVKAFLSFFNYVGFSRKVYQFSYQLDFLVILFLRVTKFSW